MTSKCLQYPIEEIETKNEGQEFSKVHQEILDGKLITAVRICIRCGRKFPLKKRCGHCPHCQGLIITKTMVLKFP